MAHGYTTQQGLLLSTHCGVIKLLRRIPEGLANAWAVGIEPTLRGLESLVLPLHQAHMSTKKTAYPERVSGLVRSYD